MGSVLNVHLFPVNWSVHTTWNAGMRQAQNRRGIVSPPEEVSQATPNWGCGSFWILAGAIWSAPPTAVLWLSAEPVARADVPFQLSVAKRAKAAALPPHSKSPTVSGPSYRTPQNQPLPGAPARPLGRRRSRHAR